MRIYNKYLLLCVMFLGWLTSCQPKPKDGRTDTFNTGVVSIASDESFQPIIQEEIDVLRLEVEKIECVDDKIYYMEKVYDKLAIVDNALTMLNNNDTKNLVRDSKAKLMKQKEQLMIIRDIIINKKISPERYGLFIKYPAGYEG